MKARLVTFLLLLTMMMMAAPQASALEIQIYPNGNIEFYSGSVLGDDDEQEGRESEDDESEDEKEDEKKSKSEHRIKSVRSNNKNFVVKDKEDKFEIELRDKDDDDDHDEFRKIERMEADDIRVKFPAKLNDNDRDKNDDDDEYEQRYAEKIREERKDRAEEMVELKNKLREKSQVLELESRKIKASLKNGAVFNLDPVTNEVMITTPSGEEHVLNHLPDQAIERMEAAGLFFGVSGEAEEELEVETNDLGELIYTKKDKVRKKLFGLFPRQVESEIVLNDTTGEVTEVELEGDSIFEQFFNSVSF
ncbi:MAG: hypothetical protein HN846_02475 [Candidatus Pacebacteria bacterium]|jgi:hypothetical protein|nr:hypothetical protein [Candidatus Paceibacterota bacterium]MBT3512291.1 hypothetical protein [Candidatus Paceibacterota bacterium]MBT4004515.1 hypothetical protein [Candidatus Paceibacterota bacterium]MBT4358847.1 hypothetical protein [Candidatus Paceibacterota bacterium]MBT4681204.1 hypothetical protein [Candidatus Paceibacterota bacterium]